MALFLGLVLNLAKNAMTKGPMMAVIVLRTGKASGSGREKRSVLAQEMLETNISRSMRVMEVAIGDLISR